MKIGFGDGGLAKLLNDYAALETRFGATLAESVAIRLGVLAAARHVGCLPRRAPIGLECDDEAQGIFSIDLGSTHRLQFRAVVAKEKRKKLAREKMEEIVVTGVVEVRPHV